MMALTGGSGFVGGALAGKLGAENVVTIGRTPAPGTAAHITADLAHISAEELADALRPYDITCFIHAAAVMPWSDADYSQDMQMAKVVAGACDALRIPRLLYMSGWVVYDPAVEAPYTEETHLKPNVPYGDSKLAIERYFAARPETTRALGLRCATIYGPGQTSPGLIPNLVGRALKGEVLQLNAKTTRRDYVYIADVVEAIAQLTTIDLPPKLNVLNIGSGASVSVREVAEAIQAAAAALGKTVAVTYADEFTEATPPDNRLAIAAAQKLGVLQGQKPFADGLLAFMKWRENAGIL